MLFFDGTSVVLCWLWKQGQRWYAQYSYRVAETAFAGDDLGASRLPAAIALNAVRKYGGVHEAYRGLRSEIATQRASGRWVKDSPLHRAVIIAERWWTDEQRATARAYEYEVAG